MTIRPSDDILGLGSSPYIEDQLMSEDLTRQLMALPLHERLDLAQALWQSIDDQLAAESPDTVEAEAIAGALKRDAELDSGHVVVRTHDQVMEAVRRQGPPWVGSNLPDST
jgi:putative addiction module component (TIGR02574 family)